MVKAALIIQVQEGQADQLQDLQEMLSIREAMAPMVETHFQVVVVVEQAVTAMEVRPQVAQRVPEQMKTAVMEEPE